MKVYIKNINVWLHGLNEPSDLTLWANNKLSLPDEFVLPKPQYYPKGQLRRLSPFSKVALNCLDTPLALKANLPLVFASRHGDLAKTVKLIKDAALGEELSPTQFALSVHNATSGLFSIATNNTAATTTISAGKNTFFEGLVEASMQCQQKNSSVIYCYCDFDVSDEYRQYLSAKPVRCITIIISNESDTKGLATIDISLIANNSDIQTSPDLSHDVDMDFIKHFYQQSTASIFSENYCLSLGFH